VTGITLGAALVALLCIAASTRRLFLAVTPTTLDPRLLHDALGPDERERPGRLASLRRALASDPRFAWEHRLFEAFDEPQGPARDELVNEALIDFDSRSERWLRVPRVCASIGTSAGLFFGSIALLEALGLPPGGEGDGGAQDAIQAALATALAAVAFGIAATAFCVAVHVRAARAARNVRVAVDALVERLRSVSDTDRRGA
jgi:hypothetical protein